MFALSTTGNALFASGVQRRLPAGTSASLEARIRAFFRQLPAEGGVPLLVGAIPFASTQQDAVIQPERIARSWAEAEVLWPGDCEFSADQALIDVTPEPSRAAYATMVLAALARIEAGEFDKVVLARTLRVVLAQPVPALALLKRLARDVSITAFLTDLSRPGHRLVGASPELLVAREDLGVRSHPLAGSARRQRDDAADREAGAALLASAKDRREHMMVVEAILDTLAPHCASLSAGATALRQTATMWHLGTAISGVLRSADSLSAAGLAALLHPTPAVGGVPREAAVRAIGELEGNQRGFYSGAVGWVDASGDGEWYVALRCAEIEGATATLHAGAGIVAGSDPQAEVEETAAKLRAMLIALDLDEIELRQEAVSL